jgi:hypothetical protein
MKLKGIFAICIGFGFLLLLSPPSYAQYVPYYVLDGYGGVHAGGGAAAITTNKPPYFGWDIARALNYVPVGYSGNYGHGVLVLDGFGGIHVGGNLWSTAPNPKTFYFGFDIARDISFRTIPPRVNFGTYSSANQEITTTTFVSVRSCTLYLPDDGFVIIGGGCSMGNNSTTYTKARVAFGVDSTTAAADNIDAEVGLPQTTHPNHWQSVYRSQGVFCAAGTHTFYLLIREQSASAGTVLYYDPHIYAVYIDMNAMGYSVAPDISGTTIDNPNTGSLGIR